eukprot:Tamp_08523.p5 GENE.Tamp_08523~~Tamp_08523.p5  ORF type:complete len:175 (-),score=25.07 Tamp_08523:1467-1991(-)
MREASKDSSRFSVCKMRKADAARGPEGMCESAAGAPRDKIGPKTPPEELYPPSPAKRLGGKSDRSLPAGSGAQAGGSSMCAVAGGDRGAPRKTHSIMESVASFFPPKRQGGPKTKIAAAAPPKHRDADGDTDLSRDHPKHKDTDLSRDRDRDKVQSRTRQDRDVGGAQEREHFS